MGLVRRLKWSCRNCRSSAPTVARSRSASRGVVGDGRNARKRRLLDGVLAHGVPWGDVDHAATGRSTIVAGNGQAVIDLDKKRMDSMCARDAATLSSLLADDLVYTHSSAAQDTKATILSKMEAGTQVYQSIEPSEVKAQDLGDAVVLTGIAKITVGGAGRQPNTFGVRFTDVYAKR